MRPIAKILVPVAFSPHTDQAIDRACGIARRYDAEIMLLHVCPKEEVPAATQRLKRLAEREGVARLQRFRCLCISGEPAQRIIEVAQQGFYDLLVISTHDKTGFCRWVVGSVAEQVVRSAPCPVLAVRPMVKTVDSVQPRLAV